MDRHHPIDARALAAFADEFWGDDKPAEIEITGTHGPKSMSHCATWDDYDGAPDSPAHPMGFGKNVQDAIDDLIEMTRDTDFDDGRIEAQS